MFKSKNNYTTTPSKLLYQKHLYPTCYFSSSSKDLNKSYKTKDDADLEDLTRRMKQLSIKTC